MLGEKRRACSVLVGKPDIQISLVRHKSREGDIEMHLREQNAGCGLDCCSSEYGQMATFFEYYNEPSLSIKCGQFLTRETVSFWRRTLLHELSELVS
jgi:hypothetical protein